MGNQLQEEWAFVTGAPILAAAFAVLATIVVWTVLHFLYRHRLEALNEEVGRLRADVERLQGRIDASPAAPAPVPIPAPPPSPTPPASAGLERKELNNILIRISNAISSAGSAVAGRGNYAPVLADMQSTLTTLRKAFDLPVPTLPERASQILCLRAGKRFLEEMQPYVRDRHIDEARDRAERLVPRLNDYVQSGGTGGLP